jgi:hypothetical protein
VGCSVLNSTPTAFAGGVQSFYKIWGTKGCGGWEAIPSVQQPSSDPAMLHHDLHPSTQGGGVGPPAVATTLQKIVSRAKLIFLKIGRFFQKD